MNPLKRLSKFRQSVWLDYIRRDLITSGELQRYLKEDGLMGVTSNPAIFVKAITGSKDYTSHLEMLQQQKGLNAMELYEQLAIRDIQEAADVLRSVYKKTDYRDGYVSLEVSPFLAHDTQGTIQEARRLSKKIQRENVMIKVPATSQGLPAIEQLISEGICVNVTLLFSQNVYEQVTRAYLSGLEKAAAKGLDLNKIASVASFFVSRIDSTLDPIIATRLKTSTTIFETTLLKYIMGKVAIANAKLTYQRYKEIFHGKSWQMLTQKGAQTQRLLWASTSTKNPSYRDVLYVEELIGPDTVNTIPPSTMDAFRDHGRPYSSLQDDIESAHNIMGTLDQLGISMKETTDHLLKEGIKIFAVAFDELLRTVDNKCGLANGIKINKQTYTLPENLSLQVNDTIEEWQISGKVWRLWAKDASLWTHTDEGNWLGWLSITEDRLIHSKLLNDIAAEVKAKEFSHALLLGMGGSILCPEVLAMTYKRIDGFPEFHILDSTDPAQIKTIEKNIDVSKTLFIVASKSGTTLEPRIYKQFFYEQLKALISPNNLGGHFIAITDPGSKLQKMAESDNFRRVYFGTPNVGGRYSALSFFGMVPAAIMGVDTEEFLERANEMAIACSSFLPINKNPGVVLGIILGILAKNGRNKVTLITSPSIWHFGAWVEQMLAESTGKDGKGLIPVDRESPGLPEAYGDDRLFIYIRLETAFNSAQDEAVKALEDAGQPVVRISIDKPYDLGQEFFRWEISTAVASSILGVNAFNQPDVESSKLEIQRLTSEFEKKGSLPPETPILEEKGVGLFLDKVNANTLAKAVGREHSLVAYLRAHLNRLREGDYFALLAYIEMSEPHEMPLQTIRHAVRDKKLVATCLGFGPRFLHSTGQIHKGGPDTGLFLQVTCDDPEDFSVPGQKYTFGLVKAAQARGDFHVLSERNRRTIRVHLGAEVRSGLELLCENIQKALN